MDEPDEDLGGRLTEAARDVTESLTADQITAIRRYQALDRTYELVAAVVRGRLSPDDLTAEQSADVLGIIDGLDLATERWRLPERVEAVLAASRCRPWRTSVDDSDANPTSCRPGRGQNESEGSLTEAERVGRRLRSLGTSKPRVAYAGSRLACMRSSTGMRLST